MKKLLTVLVVFGLIFLLIPSLGEETLPTTTEEILAAYSGYEISEGFLEPKEPTAKNSKELYQDGCAFLPALNLSKDTPYIALILDAGKKNAPNYITVETEYSVYQFEAMEKVRVGEKTTFSLFDTNFITMLSEIDRTNADVKVTYRAKEGSKGKTITLNEEQLKIIRIFYKIYNTKLQDVNLINYAITLDLLKISFDYNLTIINIKDLPLPTVNPDAAAYETVKADQTTESSAQTGEQDITISLHGGVKLGMGIREVVQTEKDAGNILYNASPNAKGIKVTPETAESVKLPWGHLYFYGKVAGGNEKSHANYEFDDAKVLTRVEYFINSSSKNEGKKLYDQIEETLKEKYGEPGASSATKTKLEADSTISKVAVYRDITRIESYSQWMIHQPDGTNVLVEHIFQHMSTNGEYNYMNYAIVKEVNNSEAGSLENDL